MFIRGLTSAAILSNTILGNLCMMPMAFVASMPIQHEEHMEMAMTPAVSMAQSLLSGMPMSPVQCEHCEIEQQSIDADQLKQQSGCAGHCFSQGNITTAVTATFNTSDTSAADPVPIAIAQIPRSTSIIVPFATAPPFFVHFDTIVLRL